MFWLIIVYIITLFISVVYIIFTEEKIMTFASIMCLVGSIFGIISRVVRIDYASSLVLNLIAVVAFTIASTLMISSLLSKNKDAE